MKTSVFNGVKLIAAPELGVEPYQNGWASSTRFEDRCCGCIGDKTSLSVVQFPCEELDPCDPDEGAAIIWIRPEDQDRYDEMVAFRAAVQLNNGLPGRSE